MVIFNIIKNVRLVQLVIALGLIGLSSYAYALSSHGDYYPHGWLKPDLYGAIKVSDQMIDFDSIVEGEETRREEFVLANDLGRAIRLSHNGRVFCYVVGLTLSDPWSYQVVDYDGSGAFEMREPAFSDLPLPRWTFVNYPFLTLRTTDMTEKDPSVQELIASLTGNNGKPCIKKYTPEQRAALAIARGGQMPPDECLPGTGGAPRVALNILFEFNRATLTDAAEDTLKILGEAMTSAALKGTTFQIEGHTDAVGNFDYNMELSRRRAYAVQRYLMANFKIPSSQLVPVGMGEVQPLPNIDPDDGRNRRVEIVNLSAGNTLTMPDANYVDLPAEPYQRR